MRASESQFFEGSGVDRVSVLLRLQVFSRWSVSLRQARPWLSCVGLPWPPYCPAAHSRHPWASHSAEAASTPPASTSLRQRHFRQARARVWWSASVGRSGTGPSCNLFCWLLCARHPTYAKLPDSSSQTNSVTVDIGLLDLPMIDII